MYDELVKKAKIAAQNSYAPYSHFNVGAALVTVRGQIYSGCNIENSAFSPTVCAERCAFFKAISVGERRFKAIAIVGGTDFEFTDFVTPCGVCRQVMAEFCKPDFEIILGRNDGQMQIYKLKELIPLGFSLDKE